MTVEVTHTFTDKELEEEMEVKEKFYSIISKKNPETTYIQFHKTYENNYSGNYIRPSRFKINSTLVDFIKIKPKHEIKITGVNRMIKKAEEDLQSKGFKLEEIK